MNASVQMAAVAETDGRRDFDFLFGEWRVEHRRLARRGAGAHDWDAFSGTLACRPLMDGLANVEEHDMAERGRQAVGFRAFDLVRRTWAIYWVSSADGLLGEPVFGRFEGGEGRFYGVDLDAGRPVKVAFVWKEIVADSAHWSQAFSYDDGQTWEMNWEMAFTRTGS
jgi:hypothetical protein